MKLIRGAVGTLVGAMAVLAAATPAAVADNTASASVVWDLPTPGTSFFPGDWHQVTVNASMGAESRFTVAGNGKAAGKANGAVTDAGLPPGDDASDAILHALLTIGFLTRLGVASVSGNISGAGIGYLGGRVWGPGQYDCTTAGRARADSSAPGEQPCSAQDAAAEMSFYEVIEPGPPGPPSEGFSLLDSVLAPDEISR